MKKKGPPNHVIKRPFWDIIMYLYGHDIKNNSTHASVFIAMRSNGNSNGVEATFVMHLRFGLDYITFRYGWLTHIEYDALCVSLISSYQCQKSMLNMHENRIN